MIGGIAQSGFRPPIPGQLPFGAGGVSIPTIATGGVAGAPYGVPVPTGLRSFGDVDPITPGVQTQPGVLTATGPSSYVGGGAFGGAGMMASGFNAGAGFVGGVDLDPITPGIQSQPGVVTPIGPPRIVSQGSGVGGATFGINASGFNQIGSSQFTAGFRGIGSSGFNSGIAGGIVDADPITPGIQAQPGVVTPIGPPRVVSRGSGVGGVALTGINASGFNQIGGFNSGIAGGVIDHDPITPGIQSQPGVVTPIGPPRVVSQGGISGGLNSGISGAIGFGGDVDPITPGFQTNPGVLTATGPSITTGGLGGVQTSGIISGGTMAFGQQQFGGIVDADPITPGIQAQPGVVTPVGPPRVVSQGGFGGVNTSVQYNQMYSSGGIANTGLLASGVVNNGFIGSGIDVDPITPGIQTQPGIVTAIGPTRVVSRGGWWNCCPWWIWPLLGLLLLGALLGGLYTCLKPSGSSTQSVEEDQNKTTTTTTNTNTTQGNDNDGNDQENGTNTNKTTEVTSESECKNGFRKNGKCIVCPEGSEWNGNSCSYQTTTETKNDEKTTVGAIDGQNPDGEDLATSKQTTKTQTTESSSGKKVPVFVDGGEQNINQALKNTKSEQGSQPQVVTSKPTNMKPSTAINAAGGVEQAGSDFVSNNIVTVPAITQKKSVPASSSSSSSISCKFTVGGCVGSHPYLGYANTGSFSLKSGSSSSSTSTTSTTSTGTSSQGSSTGGEESTGTSTEGSTQGGASTAQSGQSSSSGSGESSQSGDNSKTVTRTVTTSKDEIVDPIVSEPTHKHMRRFM